LAFHLPPNHHPLSHLSYYYRRDGVNLTPSASTALHARDINATQEAGVTFFLMGVCASCLGLNRHPSHDVSQSLEVV